MNNYKNMTREVKRERIARLLWERDYTRQLENEMVNGLVSPANLNDYLGRESKGLEPNYFRAIIKMFCALLINRFMDKCIDMVLDAHEELNGDEK